MVLLNSSTLSTHNLARILILIAFCIDIIEHFIREKRIFNLKLKRAIIPLFFLATQLLSVTTVTYIDSFIFEAKDLTISLLLYLCLSNKKNIFLLFYKVFIWTYVAQIIFELTYFINPLEIFNSLLPFLNNQYFSYLTFQAGRDRFFSSSLIETFVPFIFILQQSSRKNRNIIALLLFICITTLVLLSNWRTKFILYLSLTIICLLKLIQNKAKALFVIIITCLMIFGANIILTRNIGSLSSTIDRLTNSFDESEYSSIESRYGYWQEGIDIFVSSPLTGIGLGNYFDFSKLAKKNSILNDNRLFYPIKNPHNAIITRAVETGILGLIGYMTLIIFFLITDLKQVIKVPKNKSYVLISFSFWAVFLYSMLNPDNFSNYYVTFWGLRALLNQEKNYYEA